MSTNSEALRRILLVDCDSFFVQCAKLADPSLASHDRILVGGRPGSRGVVSSASYGARYFGVHSGMPMDQALRLCPGSIAVPVPWDECVSRSEAVVKVLNRFAPVVEPVSIDESYLDLSGTEALYRGASLEEIAHLIRTTVREKTEISVSIGGGTQKTVAKMASSRAKPKPKSKANGVFIVPPGGEADFMRLHRLSDIPGVGRVFEEELRRRGFVMVSDILPMDEKSLCIWLGASRGQWLYQRVRGIDPSSVELPGEAKSISKEETFREDLYEDSDLERELLILVEAAASSLRERRMLTRTISVKLRDSDFRDRMTSRTLPEEISSDAGIYTVALELLRSLREKRRGGVRLLGVTLSRLSSESDPRQLALFDDLSSGESQRDRTLTEIQDRLRSQFGAKAIRRGRMID